MSKSIIIGVIVLMSISLLGVVGLQLYWITDAIKVKEEQFDRSVHEALQKVVAKLETQEAVSVVTEQMANLQQPAASTTEEHASPVPSPAPRITEPPIKKAPAQATENKLSAKPAPLPVPAPVATASGGKAAIALSPATTRNSVPVKAGGLRIKINDTLLVLGENALNNHTQKIIIKDQQGVRTFPNQMPLPAPDAKALALLQHNTVYSALKADTLARQWRTSGTRLRYATDTLRRMLNLIDSVRIIRRTDSRSLQNKKPDDIQSIMVRNDTIFIFEKSPGVTFISTPEAPAAMEAKAAGKRIRVSTPKPQKISISVNEAKGTPPPSATKVVTKAKPAPGTTTKVPGPKVEAEKAEAKKEKLNNVVKQMVVEYMVKDVPLKQRLNLQKLHNLLQSELNGQGIKLDFGYWIVSGKNDTIAAHTIQQAGILPFAEYKVSLFPNDIIEKPDYLAVYFPGSKAYALKSLWMMLLLSSVFTLIIILTFGSTIYIIFRQKKLSEMKNDFINNMTHEFKTPIATISLATDSIANPKIFDNPEKIRYYNNIIREENKRMNAQVENVLQIALLEKNEFKMNLQPVDLHVLIIRAMERIKLQVEQRTGQITAQLNAINHELRSDEEHLYNVICNLLDNANKYSPQSPDIKLFTQNVEGGILIAVEDKGLGMSNETQQRVFEKFYRVPTGNLHNVKGFGLGLSYVKAIVEAHRGNIRLKSEPGKGSRFEIFLPI